MYIVTIMDKKQCTNCKVFREMHLFINKYNEELKRCLKCRNKDAKQKKNPVVKERRNKRQKDKKYYIEHRKKKREANEEEYLKHNAEIAKKWRENNKEHIAKWKTNNLCVRLGAIKQQANKKGLIWNDNMTNEICENMMKSNCFYCGFVSPDTLNGINRLDSSLGYSISNCRSCCKNCNFIKKCLDPITFIKRVSHISKIHKGIGELNFNIWLNSGSVNYNTYKTRAEKKKLEFELTNDEFDNIKNKKCYYCHKENSNGHQNGVDRKNNNIGYTIENCVTCCRECNQMKSNMGDNMFINYCYNISKYNLENNIEIPENIESCLFTIKKRDFVNKNIPKIEENYNFKETIERNTVIKSIENKIEEPFIKIGREYTKGSNLPENYKIKPDEIPKYCYYIPSSKFKGDGFYCSKFHPKQKDIGKDWFTTKSKLVSTKEKLKQLTEYLNGNIYDPKALIDNKPNDIKGKLKNEHKNKFDLLSQEQLLIIIKMKGER